MSSLAFSFSSQQLRHVKQIQFGVLAPDEIKRGSVTQQVTIGGVTVPAGITKHETFAGGQPVYGGVNDPRMGTVDYGVYCKTCNCSYSGSGSKVNDCPGHFGHVELARPVYHVGFLDNVNKILRSVCYHCSRLLISPDDARLRAIMRITNPVTRLRAVHELCKGRTRCDRDREQDKVQSDVHALVSDNVNNSNGDAIHDGHGAAPQISGGEGRSGCGGAQPKYTRKGLQIEVEYPGGDEMENIPGTGDLKQTLPAWKAFDILKNIRDEDARILGLNPRWARPEWLLVTVLPVPPPHVRPSVRMDALTRSEDDLTHQLVNIVKANIFLENSIQRGDSLQIQRQFEELLQHRVTGFFDNERADMPRETQRSGRPLKTLRQRIVGKEGRVRGNLMGKRVDFSARTVITADPNLSIDQVGVPRSIALNLTVPERVTGHNLAHMRQLVANGPQHHPGARYIVRNDGRRIDLRYANGQNDLVLEHGWTVERHLRDGDPVLFNRQPSLHKMSIMGHRVKVLPFSTFRLNLSVTSPYNADFDGDEMNLHVPQSLAARAEAETLMMVPKNIVTPQSNRNVMGIVQDSLLALQRMTKRDVFLDRALAMNILMWVVDWDGRLPTPAILKPRPLWTGKQIFTLICPRVNYRGKGNLQPGPGKSNELNAADSEVLILEGELVQGMVDKKTVGTRGGSLIHITWLEHGWEECMRFMNQVQLVVNYWILQHSYTIGVADTVADADTMEQISSRLAEAKNKVRMTMERGQIGMLETQPGMDLMQSFEVLVNMVLNDARSAVGKSAQNSLSERNKIKAMVDAGSKGSLLNISQIIACVGQQNVQGKRIQYGFQQRTLPHFAKDDLGPESHGFVENSYLRGLTPQEFFFHAMAGREGLIDTAVKTSETGYIQRRLVKAMESVMVRYDGTLRDSSGHVIQFLYGEDGMDAQRVEQQHFDHYLLGYEAFAKKYEIDTGEDFGSLPYRTTSTGEVFYYLSQDVIQQCYQDAELIPSLDEEREQLEADRVELREILAVRDAQGDAKTENSVYLPVNMNRLIWNAQRKFDTSLDEPTDLHPREVLDAVQEICSSLRVVVGDDHLSREAHTNATKLFCMLVRSKLATKRVLVEYRLSRAALDWLKGQIIAEFHAALANPGEMAGVLAAQSLGEPATQMTLNTFHNTGISAKNVTLGVPRLNELLNVAKTVKTPSVFVYLKRQFAQDQDQAHKLQMELEYTTLSDITQQTEIHYDPDPTTTVIDEDKILFEEYFDMPDEDVTVDTVSPWVLRVVLIKEAVWTRNLRMETLAARISEHVGDCVQVIFTDDNASSLALRIRIKTDGAPPSMHQEGDGDGGGASARMNGGGLSGGGLNGSAGVHSGGGADVDDDDAEGSGEHDDEYLRRMQAEMLANLQLCGIANIKKVYVRHNKRAEWHDDEPLEGFVNTDETKEWVLETDGTNLAGIMAHERVDASRCVSNDVCEMMSVLGIEGVRAALLYELRHVISFDGSYVNYRHLACLVDVMTFYGYIMAISRHGVNRSDAGPMLRASFEETVEILMEAAMFSEKDTLNAVTSNVMLGQLAQVGTGSFDLLLDTKRLPDIVESDGMVAEATMGLAHQLTPARVDTPAAMTMGGVGVATPFGAGAGFSPSPYSPAASPSPAHSPVMDHFAGKGDQQAAAAAAAAQQSGAYSPAYHPHSAAGGGGGGAPMDLDTSPAYSPTSPQYSPTSPAYGGSPTSPAYSPTSPVYGGSPTSPAFSPTSPAYGAASPTSPQYSPTSPAYGGSPTSPAYSPTSPAAASPTSPAYSPTSPDYSPGA